jgi:hypothetical protein
MGQNRWISILVTIQRMFRIVLLHCLLATGFVSLSVRAEEITPRLSLPIKCEIGRSCYIQNFYDHDPGPAYMDYHCGSLTYDGHKGTDIRLSDLPAMSAGVEVRAAADGKVRAVRDGMDDVSIRKISKSRIQNREAGNSVLIDHGNGWLTLYAHMRKGSVSVAPGQAVKVGERLGLVGLSGNTEFPHLHFEVRHNGQPIDPFLGSTNSTQYCNATEQSGLWDASTRAHLGYMPSGILASGFTTQPPTQESIMQYGAKSAKAAPSQPVLLFWVNSFGIQSGDREELRLLGPDGSVLAEKTSVIPTNQALWLSYSGLRRKDGNWPPGNYRGEFSVIRIVAGKPHEILRTTTNLIFDNSD